MEVKRSIGRKLNMINATYSNYLEVERTEDTYLFLILNKINGTISCGSIKEVEHLYKACLINRDLFYN